MVSKFLFWTVSTCYHLYHKVRICDVRALSDSFTYEGTDRHTNGQTRNNNVPYIYEEDHFVRGGGVGFYLSTDFFMWIDNSYFIFL